MFQSVSNIVLGYFSSEFFKFSFVFINCRLFEGITFVLLTGVIRNCAHSVSRDWLVAATIFCIAQADRAMI